MSEVALKSLGHASDERSRPLNPAQTLNPTPQPPNPKPLILKPKLYTINPETHTPHLTPHTTHQPLP